MGDHDENVDFDDRRRDGRRRRPPHALRDLTLAVYARAEEHRPRRAGIILADTKFEFGTDAGPAR